MGNRVKTRWIKWTRWIKFFSSQKIWMCEWVSFSVFPFLLSCSAISSLCRVHPCKAWKKNALCVGYWWVIFFFLYRCESNFLWSGLTYFIICLLNSATCYSKFRSLLLSNLISLLVWFYGIKAVHIHKLQYRKPTLKKNTVSCCCGLAAECERKALSFGLFTQLTY